MYSNGANYSIDAHLHCSTRSRMLLGIYCVSVYPFFPVYRTPLVLTDSDQSRIQKAERKAREIESSSHDRLEVSFLVFYSFNSLYFSLFHSLALSPYLSLTHTHTQTLIL